MTASRDTGYWYALDNAGDRHHRRAVEIGTGLEANPVTTWPVPTETCHLLQRSLGVDATTKFLNSLERSGVEVFDLGYGHLPRIDELMRKYASLPMDLADASLVILAEHLGRGRILSTDRRDFDLYRWKNHDPFENVLLPDG